MQKWDSDIECYLNAIGGWPLLAPDEARDLLVTIAKSTQQFRDALARIPGTAHRIAEMWQEKADRGLVTGMLCHRAHDDRDTDWSSHLDRIVEKMQCALRIGDATNANALADLVAEADIRFELLEEIHSELSDLAGSQTRAGRVRARTFGLTRKHGRAALAEAAEALHKRCEAKQQFACCNLRLVVARAKRFRSMGVRFEDLIQEGNLGLLRAIDKFEPARGHLFSTYAVWWIDQALVRAIQNQSRTIRLPSHLYDRLREMRRGEDRLHTRLGTLPSRADLAQELGLEEEELEQLSVNSRPLRSLDEPLSDADGDASRSVVDMLADPDDERPEDALHQKQIDEAVKRCLRRLPQRERRVLTLRYGLGGLPPVSLRDIGKELGLTGERVRQIAKGALSILSTQEDLAALDADPAWTAEPDTFGEAGTERAAE